MPSKVLGPPKGSISQRKGMTVFPEWVFKPRSEKARQASGSQSRPGRVFDIVAVFVVSHLHARPSHGDELQLSSDRRLGAVIEQALGSKRQRIFSRLSW